VLAAEGKKVVVRENRELAAAYKAAGVPTWPFALAESLVRSTHARRAEGLHQAFANYIKSGHGNDMTPIRGFSSSFGPDALQRAVLSFRTIGASTGAASLRSYTGTQLVSAQSLAVEYAMKRELSGLGAWLFCAPFEIMALIRPSLWEDPMIERLLMPLGSPLARGYGMLAAAGLADVDEKLLRDSEPGIRNGLTLLYIARACDQKVAQTAGSRPLFIHHGVAALGQVK